MLNNEQKQIVEDNIGLVYKYAKIHNITDQDEIGDLLCEFCKVVDKGTYDKEKGSFSTFIWNSLTNYQRYKYRANSTIKRTLDTCDLLSLNKPYYYKNGDNSDMEWGEVIPCDHDCFGEIELEGLILRMRDRLERQDSRYKAQKKIKRVQILDEMIYSYLYENGRFNASEVSIKYGISRQRINDYVIKFRQLAKEMLYDEA